jgi:hypothetical protein
MSEKNTGVLLEILFPGQKIESQLRVPYQTKPRKVSWTFDFSVPERSLVIEYDGPDHYRDVWKIERDERKDGFCNERGLVLVRIPYWLQMQKGVPDYLFKMHLTSEQEKAIARRIYKVPDVSLVMYSGLYGSPHTPANFIEKGRKRFRAELTTLPSIVLVSFRATMKAYIDRVGDAECVVPADLMDLLIP